MARPAVLEPKANPSDVMYLPRPEWYFLPLFQLLKLFQGELAIIGTVIIPGILFSLLFLAPFLDRSIERSPFKRRLASISMLAILTMLGSLLLMAKRDDGAFLAASDVDRLTKIPVEQINQLSSSEKKNREAAMARLILDQQAEKAGKFLSEPFQPYEAGGPPVQKKKSIPPPPGTFAQCSECHGQIGGDNGMMAPDLINIGEKFDKDKVIQLMMEPEAFNASGMPRFGNDKMSAANREALAGYLVGLSKK